MPPDQLMLWKSCSVENCVRPIEARGYCSKHYKRWQATGSASYRRCPTCNGSINLGPGHHAYCSEECRPTCSVERCERPTRGTTPYCEGHRRETTRRWSATGTPCVVCGAQVQKGIGYRAYCSDSCKKLGRRRPKSYDCARCGDSVSLVKFSPQGSRARKTNRRLRSDAALCPSCRRRPSGLALSVRQLFLRDGPDCKICGHAVDLNAKGDLKPSIDHRLPRSLGGSDEADNLQLTHLWCNMFKNNRRARKPSGALLKQIAAEVNYIATA